MRKAALLRILATMQEESYFIDAYVNVEVCRAREFHQSSSEAASLRKRIEWLEIREKQLSKENNAFEARLSAQTITAQRERNGLHRKLVCEAKQTLKAEIAQRAALQGEVESLRESTKQAGEQLQVAESRNKFLQENEAVLKTELSEITERLQRLESEISQVTRERDNECERATKLSKEFESSKNSIDIYKKREKQLCDQIAQNEVDLEGLETSRAEMHANLENLFGDMVSLANAYELKEKEVSSGHKNKESTIEKLEKDLDKERQRRKELEDKYRQVEYENEALSRKYAKAREKLEEERKQRSQAQASQANSRRGDTSKSYIQQLQLSTSRSTSQCPGKENSSRSSRGSGSKIR